MVSIEIKKIDRKGMKERKMRWRGSAVKELKMEEDEMQR